MDITNAMAAFDLAETAELDCGSFDIIIRQAAAHNNSFKAAVTKKSLKAKKKSLAVTQGSLTGSEDTDIELFVESVIVGWGERPLKDNDGNAVAYSPDVMRAIFEKTGKPGKVLFSKIMVAAMQDDTFVTIPEEDLGNSSPSSESSEI